MGNKKTRVKNNEEGNNKKKQQHRKTTTAILDKHRTDTTTLPTTEQKQFEKQQSLQHIAGPKNVVESSESTITYDEEVYQKVKLAIENNNVPLFEEYVKVIKVNMQDPEDGNTLLHWCACYNRCNFAKELLSRGAKEILNSSNTAPVEIAMKIYDQGDSSYFEIRNLLGLTTRKQLGWDK